MFTLYSLVLSRQFLLLCVLPANIAAVSAESANSIPFGVVAVGQQDIVRAWLTNPTGRYPHGVLGDDIEATALKVELHDGLVLQADLSVRVFEDNAPRLSDIDGDGRDEVWTVVSDVLSGARLVSYGVKGGELVVR